LRLAASRIHGKVLKPGDVFSYNQIVGNRTFQQGFRMAPVILDGKLVPDWGGGVCQVSSTLYNAALLADLDIVDRTNHGRAIGYVPLGFDATVVDDQIDFKFKNSLKYPIMLYATVTDSQLYFFIIGNAKDMPPPIELDYVVHKVIEPVEIKQPDPTLDVGAEVVDESPQRGFRVSTYRIRKIDGKEVRQLLSTDDYDPVNRIVKVGTKTPPGVPGTSTMTTVKQPDKPPGQPSTGTITLQNAQTPRPLLSTPTKR
jgi:vancomycin resistance protein YoaR